MVQTVAGNRSKYEDEQPLKQPPSASDEPPSKRGRQAPKPVRGVFEHPPNSGIWWVNYYVDGKRHREKVGTRKAAADLYSKRKNDARMGVKLPDSLKAKRAVLFEELAKDAMEYSKAHKKSHRTLLAWFDFARRTMPASDSSRLKRRRRFEASFRGVAQSTSLTLQSR